MGSWWVGGGGEAELELPKSASNSGAQYKECQQQRGASNSRIDARDAYPKRSHVPYEATERVQTVAKTRVHITAV